MVSGWLDYGGRTLLDERRESRLALVPLCKSQTEDFLPGGLSHCE